MLSVKQKVTALAESLHGYEVGEAVKTRAFWMLVVAQVAWGLSATAVAIHLVAYLTGIGYTLRFATIAYGVLAGMAALGKPTMGVLADRIGGKNALGIALILIAGSNILVLGAGHEWLIVLYLLVGGISIAAPGALVPLVLANMCGLRRFGTLYGWIQGCVTLGLFGGPLVAGRLYDLTHSYTTSFELASLIAVAGAVAGFLCVAPRPVGLVTLSQPQGSTA